MTNTTEKVIELTQKVMELIQENKESRERLTASTLDKHVKQLENAIREKPQKRKRTTLVFTFAMALFVGLYHLWIGLHWNSTCNFYYNYGSNYIIHNTMRIVNKSVEFQIWKRNDTFGLGFNIESTCVNIDTRIPTSDDIEGILVFLSNQYPTFNNWLLNQQSDRIFLMFVLVLAGGIITFKLSFIFCGFIFNWIKTLVMMVLLFVMSACILLFVVWYKWFDKFQPIVQFLRLQ